MAVEAALAPLPSGITGAPPSSLAAFWHAFRENKGAVIGAAVAVLIAVLAILADVVAPHAPLEQFRDAVKAPPVWAEGGRWTFVLGTDGLGRDMLSRLIYGARVSLLIGLSVMVVSFGLGVVLGLAAAFNAAVRKAEETSNEKMGKLTAGMPGLPGGMKFPL